MTQEIYSQLAKTEANLVFLTKTAPSIANAKELHKVLIETLLLINQNQKNIIELITDFIDCEEARAVFLEKIQKERWDNG